MAPSSIRKFEINNKKPPCKLDSNEITIRKTVLTRRNERIFELGIGDAAKIQCFPGYIGLVYTKGKAEGCGIAQILMRLCLNDGSIHDVANQEANLAMRDILYSDLEILQKWAQECTKIVYMTMSADPKSGAYVYFKSVRASGFNQMFIRINDQEMYPKSGPCSVETLQERYNEGNMVEGKDVEDVYEKNWYFCLPKRPSAQSKCSNL